MPICALISRRPHVAIMLACKTTTILRLSPSTTNDEVEDDVFKMRSYNVLLLNISFLLGSRNHQSSYP